MRVVAIVQRVANKFHNLFIRIFKTPFISPVDRYFRGIKARVLRLMEKEGNIKYLW